MPPAIQDPESEAVSGCNTVQKTLGIRWQIITGDVASDPWAWSMVGTLRGPSDCASLGRRGWARPCVCMAFESSSRSSCTDKDETRQGFWSRRHHHEGVFVPCLNAKEGYTAAPCCPRWPLGRGEASVGASRLYA